MFALYNFCFSTHTFKCVDQNVDFVLTNLSVVKHVFFKEVISVSGYIIQVECNGLIQLDIVAPFQNPFPWRVLFWLFFVVSILLKSKSCELWACLHSFQLFFLRSDSFPLHYRETMSYVHIYHGFSLLAVWLCGKLITVVCTLMVQICLENESTLLFFGREEGSLWQTLWYYQETLGNRVLGWIEN